MLPTGKPLKKMCVVNFFFVENNHMLFNYDFFIKMEECRPSCLTDHANGLFLKLLIKSSLFCLYCSDSYRFFCPHTFERKIESNDNLQFSK